MMDITINVRILDIIDMFPLYICLMKCVALAYIINVDEISDIHIYSYIWYMNM